ncbi:MmcQ/YjbR family DNA-binding protein [Terracidiphilus gabretensis]|jgi:YjbR|uniref:MmcQ/YjbR family DNA-binding protein n=1 Tax=Terracidiphilus gabretensis TaxID=1577687 RepID=UPI0009EA8E27|nr:MmcQ/YjbR family DNA-binding protein [Terracidiphilus gabretensis]
MARRGIRDGEIRKQTGAGLSVADFRRIALSMEGAEEGSHMGSADFRVGGRIFATLAMQSKGYGNLMLTPGMQAGFIAEQPEVFLPVFGGWGRMGATHVLLAAANEDLLTGALHTAWKLRVEKNRKPAKKRAATKKRAEN